MAFETSFSERVSEIEKHIHRKSAVETIGRELKLLDHRFEKLQDELTKLPKDDERFTKSMYSLNQLYSATTTLAISYINKEKASESKRAGKIKLDKIPLPRFAGDIRGYPKFRSDFDKLVLPNIAAEEAGFTLRQCLSKDVLSCLSSCEDDAEIMLKKLDEKYGDTCQLVNVIVSEVRGLKKVGLEGTKALIHIVNTIEKGYNDLKLLGLEKELCNATVTREVENKLPHDVSLTWYRKVYDPVSKIDRNNKFPELLEYLKIERDAREYGYNEPEMNCYSNRNSSNLGNLRNCYIHNSDNHSIWQCYGFLQKNNEERVAFIREKNGCWRCLQQGHRASECVTKEKCGVDGCEKRHHSTLHGADVAGISFCTDGMVHSAIMTPCLMIIMEVKSTSAQSVNILWDTAATVSLMTFKRAEELQLKPGKQVNLMLETTGGTIERVSSVLYQLPIKMYNGNVVTMGVYGIKRISTKIYSISLKGKWFSNL